MSQSFNNLNMSIKREQDIIKILTPIGNILTHVCYMCSYSTDLVWCRNKIKDILSIKKSTDAHMIVGSVYINTPSYTRGKFKPGYDITFDMWEKDKTLFNISIKFYNLFLRIEFQNKRGVCGSNDIEYWYGDITENLRDMNSAIVDIIMPRIYNRDLFDLLDVMDNQE